MLHIVIARRIGSVCMYARHRHPSFLVHHQKYQQRHQSHFHFPKTFLLGANIALALERRRQRRSLIIHKEDLWIDNDTRTDFTCLRIKDIQGQQLLISIYLTYRFKNIGSTTTGPITWMLDRIHLLRLIQFFGNFDDFSKLQVECRSTYLVS